MTYIQQQASTEYFDEGEAPSHDLIFDKSKMTPWEAPSHAKGGTGRRASLLREACAYPRQARQVG